MKFLAPIIFALSLLPSVAQDDQKERTCRVIFLERPGDAPDHGYLFDGVTTHEVELTGMNFSGVVKLPGGKLVLGMTPDPVETPEEFPKGAPILAIPEGLTDFYLVVVSDPANEIIPVRMQAVSAGEGLKPGQTLWINLTTHAIAGKLGDEKLTIPPGAKVVGNAPLAASGYYRAIFAYQPEGGGDYQPVMRKSWWFDANSKSLGFIINSGGRVPSIFTFRDHRVAENRKKRE